MFVHKGVRVSSETVCDIVVEFTTTEGASKATVALTKGSSRTNWATYEFVHSQNHGWTLPSVNVDTRAIGYYNVLHINIDVDAALIQYQLAPLIYEDWEKHLHGLILEA
jgi:hypothetical protein